MDKSIPVPAPIPLALSAPLAVEDWNEEVWQTLFAVLDAITPSIVVDSEATDSKTQLRITEAQCQEAYERTKKNLINAPDYPKFKEFLRSRPTSIPEYEQGTRRFIGCLNKTAQADLGRLLRLLKYV